MGKIQFSSLVLLTDIAVFVVPVAHLVVHIAHAHFLDTDLQHSAIFASYELSIIRVVAQVYCPGQHNVEVYNT